MSRRALYTDVIIGSATFPFNHTVLKEIPLLREKDLETAPVVVECPIKGVDMRHLSTISKLVRGTKIIPTIDLISHADVLIVLKLSNFLGLDSALVSSGFANWIAHSYWTNLWSPEHLYLIYCVNPDLVDFGKLFKDCPTAVESIAKFAELPEAKAQPATLIEGLMFFGKYDFASCFAENNHAVQAQIKSLEDSRKKIWKAFLLDPHSGGFSDYLRFIPTNHTVWNCKGISSVESPEAYDAVIAPADVARKQLSEFTFGLLDKSPNENLAGEKFPFENVIIAGGGVTKILSPGYNRRNARQSDVDLFIIGKNNEERARVFKKVLEWFHSINTETRMSNTYYALWGSVVSIYIKDIRRKFQLISINMSNPHEILNHFDLTHIQWSYSSGRFLGTPAAFLAAREKVARVNNAGRLKTLRMIKALHCGYSLLKTDDIVENYVDITPLVDDPGSHQMQSLLRELHKWYYPVTDLDMSPEEERQHILSQISEDSNATLVTDDPKFVIDNVTIGGNFEDGYESVLYTTFNPAIVENRVVGRRVQRITLRSKHGQIRLTTSIMKIARVIVAESGLTIVAIADGAFRDFCNMLEVTVYRLFRQHAVTRHLVNDKLEISFEIPQHKLDKQITSGKSCLRNQRGAALNIEEELHVGDDFQVLFMTDVVDNTETGDRAIELRPLVFVKYEKYNIDQPTEVAVEDMPAEEFDGEITYED